MRFTLTKHARDVIEARKISMQWLEAAIAEPGLKKLVSETEVHFFKTIEAANDKCLKVVEG